jgi:hypothetical protein
MLGSTMPGPGWIGVPGVQGDWTTPLLSTPAGPFGFSILLYFFYFEM